MKKMKKGRWKSYLEKKSRLTVVTYTVVRLLVVLVLVRSIFTGQLESVFTCLLTLFLLFLPAIVSRKLHMQLSGNDRGQKQQKQRQKAGEHALQLSRKNRAHQHKHHKQTHHRIGDYCQSALFFKVAFPAAFFHLFHSAPHFTGI